VAQSSSTAAVSSRVVPDCRIDLNGKELPLDRDARLTRVVIDLDVDLIGQCVLVFHDPAMDLIDGDDFAAGASVEVSLGFAHHLQTVFHGEVVALQPQFRRDLPPALEVVCQESIHRLALSSRSRSFNAVDAMEVVREIAREHGLRGDAPGGTKQHIAQWNVSDATLLRRLAHQEGKHLRIEGNKLVVGAPPRRADIPVTRDGGFRKFKLTIAAPGQVSEVSVHGWDPKSKQGIVGKGKPEGDTGHGGRKHGADATLSIADYEPPPADVATAEAMAKGRMQNVAERFVTARIEMIGNPEILPGAVLVLEKIDPQLDGRYRVDFAHHEFSKRGYWVEANLVWLSRKSGGNRILRTGAQRLAGADVGEWRPPTAGFQPRPASPPDECGQADGVAQAKALQEAAKDGAPFCEKCEAARKAARAAERSTAELQSAAPTDVPARLPSPAEMATAQLQAATLRGAAQSGAAFCEKCEAAKEAVRKAQEAAAESMRRTSDAQRAPAIASASAVPPAIESAAAERQAAQAQAATLRTAAEAGAPFCEKCEAARRALQAARGGAT
jgi:phage protein D